MAGSSSSSPGPVADPAQEIVVDPNHHNDDNDSTLGDDSCSTASLNSTILEYRKLHGRTFHNFKDAEYWGPNDEHQNEGLDLNHHMLYLALDHKLYHAPIDKPQKVLDVGTGTGIWAMDFADEFPEAEVIGVDLSPTQPSWVPPNCRFEIDDVTQEWTYPENSFDYIHLRFMSGCFKDWVSVYKQCYRCLKPGGILEHQDFSLHVRSDDGSIPEDSIWTDWARVCNEAGEKLGQTFEVIDDDKWVGWLEEAGFTNVQTKAIKTPVGGWPADKKQKEIGQFNRLGLETSLEGYTLYLLTTILGWKYEEVQLWLVRVRQALKNKHYHGYTTWGVAWVQKPMA